MMELWRLASETNTYSADDLSGAGAKATGGRWNSPGSAVTYTGTNIALCVLESIVHFNAGFLPGNRILLKIEVPDAVWEARVTFDPATNIGWDIRPAGVTSIQFGDNWINSSNSLLLVVPSVIVPEEMNVLINPNHPDLNQLRCSKVRVWAFDSRV